MQDRHGHFASARLLLGMALVLGLAVGRVRADEREADHEALRDLLGRAVAAINTCDFETLLDCLDDPFVFTLADQVALTNRADVSAYYERILNDPKSIVVSVETAPKAEILTRFLGPDAGYCYGSGVDTYTLKNGRRVKINNRWTGVVRRVDGAWKVSAVHVGVNFLDNPVLRFRAMSFWRRALVGLGWLAPPSD